MIQAVVAGTQSLAAEKNLPLKVTVPADLPAALGDERRITQVLLNLVGNAIKFTDSGEVRIEVAATDGCVGGFRFGYRAGHRRGGSRKNF